VLIRCEKCATLYELDDNMLPPGGAPVQCSRCQHVFTAYREGQVDGDAGTTAPAREEGTSSEAGGAVPEAAPTSEATVGGSAPESGGGPLSCGGAAAAPEDLGPSSASGEAAPGGVEAAGPAPASTGQVAVDGATGTPESAAAGTAQARASAAGPKQRGAAPHGADGQPQARTASNGAGADEPKFTADGRPIRKVPFPEDAAALSPRTATARPALQAAGPRGGERARLPWLVPVVVALILVFAAVVAWRLLTARAGQDAGHQPAEGHSSLLRTGGSGSAPDASPTPRGRPALAAREGVVGSPSDPGV
jgi:predicted Zn finger-like uncharacterized protein